MKKNDLQNNFEPKIKKRFRIKMSLMLVEKLCSKFNKVWIVAEANIIFFFVI